MYLLHVWKNKKLKLRPYGEEFMKANFNNNVSYLYMSIKDIDVGGNALPIREFKLKWMKKNPTIALIAKRGSGKSWVCRSILKFLDKKGMPGGIVIAPTDDKTHFYSEFFPETFIHYEFETSILENVLDRQKKIIKKMNEKRAKGKKIDPRIYVVMDDCLASKGKWDKERSIREIFQNGRHYFITYILVMQYPLGIKPELRSNFDYIFLLHEEFHNVLKKIYENYAGMFPNLDSFKQVFNELTDNHGCMVINNRSTGKNLIDKIFWYRAKEEDNKLIGCNQFIRFHKLNYNKNWEDDKDYVFDMDKYVKKKGQNTSFKVAKVNSIK